MKYLTPVDLVNAHIQDLQDSSEAIEHNAVEMAMTTLVALLMKIHSGDSEQVIEDLGSLFRIAQRGIDSGALKFDTAN